MNEPYVALADRFARALSLGQFDVAHSLLTEGEKAQLSEASLKKEYLGMIDYGHCAANHVEVMQAHTSWSQKKEGDIGWAYVAIAGDNFSEAVAVVVTRTPVGIGIRSIEWGRP